MSYILGFDASIYQGTNISFPQVKAAGYLFGISRATYAYPGQPLKIDPSFNGNYYGMASAGIQPGGYHKVGWTDPIAEADFFIKAMSPLAENDLLAYDIEPASDVAIPSNWSEWEQQFVQRIHDTTNGTWPIRYENISMNNSMPKQGCVTNCASWVAAPSYSWADTVPVNTPVIIQQGATAHIPGITANVCDTDAFFGTGTPDELLAELKKLGYHAANVSQPQTTLPVSQTPSPAPSTPVSEPVAPTATPTPTPSETSPAPTSNTPSSTPSTKNTTTSSTTVSASSLKTTTPIKPHWYDIIIKLIRWIFS